MGRIEPTIGTTDLDDAANEGAHTSAQRAKRVRVVLTDWLVILLLFAAVAALSYWVTLKADLLPSQFQLGAPKLFERLLIVVGFAVVFGSQLLGSLRLFSFGFERGALALLLPGYLPFALKRSGIFWSVMGPWCVGILLVVAGTILLS